jgi:hypothetical protein
MAKKTFKAGDLVAWIERPQYGEKDKLPEVKTGGIRGIDPKERRAFVRTPDNQLHDVPLAGIYPGTKPAVEALLAREDSDVRHAETMLQQAKSEVERAEKQLAETVEKRAKVKASLPKSTSK